MITNLVFTFAFFFLLATRTFAFANFRPQTGHPAHGVLRQPQAWWPRVLLARVERMKKCFADAAAGSPTQAPAEGLLHEWQPEDEPVGEELCELFPYEDGDETADS